MDVEGAGGRRAARWLRSLAVSAAFALAGAASVAQDAAPEQTVRLQFRADGFFGVVTEAAHVEREVRFKKEPDFGTNGVVRTALAYGPGRDDYIGLVWDRTANRLYVDSNRNLDLTDDEPRFHKITSQFVTAQAPGIPVGLPGPDGLLPYRLDLTFIAMAGFRCDGFVRSGWEGTATLDGEPWTIAVVDNLNGKIDEHDSLFLYRDKGFKLDDNTRQRIYAVNAMSEVCINGRTYALEYAFEGAEEASELVVAFREKQVPTGTLAIAGEQVERVTFRGKVPLILDSPRGTVTVPARQYGRSQVFLFDPGRDLAYLSLTGSGVRVTENGTATLVVGAPLDNSVEVSRWGGRLNLEYRCLGIGGETYEILASSRSVLAGGRAAPPRVAVYQDGKKIASAAFEYG